jgi:hypothetical protein
MIPSPPPPRTNQQQQQQQQQRMYPQTHNLAEMARLHHRLGRAYSHEGVISDIDIYYPDEDGKVSEQKQ